MIIEKHKIPNHLLKYFEPNKTIVRRGYISHLCDIFSVIYDKLSPMGACWVNIADSYASHAATSKNVGGFTGKQMKKNKGYSDSLISMKKHGVKDKSLIGIPEMFVLEMQRRGWIRRNTIIWWKNNCMPSSTPNRFTVDFEYLYFFVKSNKPNYYINSKSFKTQLKKPVQEYVFVDLLNDVEYSDKPQEFTKEKLPCPDCKGEGILKTVFGDLKCSRCEGKGKIRHWIKKPLWSGRDYYFEQQFEGWKDNNPHDLKRAGKLIKYNGKHKNTKENKSVVVGNPSLGRNKRSVWEFSAPQENIELWFNVLKENLGVETATEIFNKFLIQDGKNKSIRKSVWNINTQGFSGAHYAVFNEDLIKPVLMSCCPKEICNECGLPREKIYKTKTIKNSWGNSTENSWKGYPKDGRCGDVIKRKFINYSDCGCGAGFHPGTVLDPFAGSGTTASLAQKLNLNSVSIDINPSSIELFRSNERLGGFLNQMGLHGKRATLKIIKL